MPTLRLRSLFVACFLLLSLVLTAVLVGIQSSRFKDYALADLKDKGKSMAQNVAFSVTDFLITENYAPMQEFIAEIAKRPHVVALAVSGIDGVMLAHSDVNSLGSLMPDFAAGVCLIETDTYCVRRDDKRHHLIITAKILVESTALGRVRVTMDMAPIYAQVSAIRDQGMLTALLVWLAFSLVGVLGARLMTGSLAALVRMTRGIGQGDFSFQPPRARGVSEIKDLSEALAGMAAAIARREQELRRSEEKFRLLFERAMEGVFIAGGDGVLREVNPAMVEILGYDRAREIEGLNLFHDLFCDQEKVGPLLAGFRQTGFVKNQQVCMRHRANHRIHCAFSCHAVLDAENGEIVRIEGLVRDVSEQVKSAEEIALIRNYLNNIIESMPSMLITVNAEGLVTQWNTAAYRSTGITSAKALGRSLWEILPHFSKYRSQLDETVRDRSQVRLDRESMDLGEAAVYNMTFFPLIANGSTGTVIRLDDVTELDRKEQQLAQAQKMESIGTLAGGLAHDFNNILGGILGTISLVQFKFNTGRDLPREELTEYLERMDHAGRRAAELVRQLLTLSRRQEIHLVPVDLNFSLKHVGKIGETTFDKSVEMRVLPADQPAYVLADPAQVEQVILNVCINAVHGMTIMRPPEDEWGGRLTLELKDIEVDKAFLATHPEAVESRYWMIQVADTGVGMSPKTVTKIFDPFFTTKEKGHGTGLGLAMVYNIVQQQHGFLDVYSEEGLGTTFNIYLPLLERAVETATASTGKICYSGTGRILVVDDDEIIRATTRDILELAGYEVLAAHDGLEGVQLFREQHGRIDLVILDMVMPRKSGRETYRAIKAIKPDVLVLMVSGFRHDERVEEIMQLGADCFLQKPFTMKNLTETVHKVLHGSEPGERDQGD